MARTNDKRSMIQRVNREPETRKELRSFLKGVFVTVRPSNVRKKITDVVPNAGEETFSFEGSMISVAVRTTVGCRVVCISS